MRILSFVFFYFVCGLTFFFGSLVYDLLFNFYIKLDFGICAIMTSIFGSWLSSWSNPLDLCKLYSLLLLCPFLMQILDRVIFTVVDYLMGQPISYWWCYPMSKITINLSFILVFISIQSLCCIYYSRIVLDVLYTYEIRCLGYSLL